MKKKVKCFYSFTIKTDTEFTNKLFMTKVGNLNTQIVFRQAISNKWL